MQLLDTGTTTEGGYILNKTCECVVE